jgi:deoxyribodipyrimidine photo-lyase
MARTLVWFRGKDLRLSDHLPLRSALEAGEVIPLFVLDPFFFAPERARELPHRMQFLLDSLGALAQEIEQKGSRLLLARGPSLEVIPRLAQHWRVDRVVAQRWTEPFARVRDERVARRLGVPLELFEGETLLPPGTLRTGAGRPYAVFTPFARAFGKAARIAAPLPAPKRLPPLPSDLQFESCALPSLAELGLERNAALLAGGERAAQKRLQVFLDGPAAEYATGRDRMDRAGTSRLSADLKFGTLSPRAVWRAIDERLGAAPGSVSFKNELVWREFNYSTLWDRPALLSVPFRSDFRSFPWRFDEDGWRAWVAGATGYPIVDASARQLLSEGYVHNRARMISASFLTKHLLIHYRFGERHYLKYLTDGDWAQNNAGWQWSAGCGVDAQPYFRVFNPVTQGERFDPSGEYVRRWVPELRGLPDKYLHAPWTAPPGVLAQAGVRLGRDYPLPIVDHKEARSRFLYVAEQHLGRSTP